MTRAIMIVVFVVCVGCGGPATPQDPPLNPGVSGVWTGDLTIAPQNGAQAAVLEAWLWVDAEGNAAHVLTPCPNGDGELVAEGAENVASWSGTLSCSKIAMPGCEDVTPVMQTLSLVYDPPTDTLHMDASGTLIGCGTSVPAKFAFDGEI